MKIICRLKAFVLIKNDFDYHDYVDHLFDLILLDMCVCVCKFLFWLTDAGET